MNRVHQFAWRSAGLLALGLAVASCSSSDQATTPPPGGGTTVRQEDTFGGTFAKAFRADSNSEPYSPADGDIIPVSLNSEPVDIK